MPDHGVLLVTVGDLLYSSVLERALDRLELREASPQLPFDSRDQIPRGRQPTLVPGLLEDQGGLDGFFAARLVRSND